MSDSIERALAAHIARGIATGALAACAPAAPPETMEVALTAVSATAEPTTAFQEREPAKVVAAERGCVAGRNDCKGKGECRVLGRHECKGRNECKGLGGPWSAACERDEGGLRPKAACRSPAGCGTGTCRGSGPPFPSKASCGGRPCHACKALNACKGLGGCKVMGRHDCNGRNACKGLGGCKTC